MSFFIFLLFGVFLNTVVSENSKRILIHKNVTGVLGKEAVFQCEYTGMENVAYSSWFTKTDTTKVKVAGYTIESYVNNKRFSYPQSNKNLTVKITGTQLEDENIYICAFSTAAQELEETLYLTVLVPPDVYISSSAQTENEDEYQSIECTAFNSKPAANISWVVSGLIADSITQTTNKHLNGTFTQRSVYRFPTYLHEGKDITCMVDHPTFTEVKTMMIQVPSYTVPNMTVQIYTTNENETEYKTIECTAAKGKPAAKIAWVLPENKSGEINYGITADNGTETVTSTYRFPAHLHEGQSINCVIEHPKLAIKEVKTISLPAYYLSSMHVRDGETVNKPNPTENEVMYRVVLKVGQRNQTIVIEVEGNVPRYTLKCIKQNDSLPLDIKVVKNGIFFEGPIKESHSGIFICIASYHGHQLSVPVEIQVYSEKPVPPNISTLVFDEAEHKVIRCIAANSKPAARITWNLPGNLPGDVMYNSAFENGTHTVIGDVSISADLPEEHNITCVIEHPAFEAPETRIIHIPPCYISSIKVLHESRMNGKVILQRGRPNQTIELKVNGNIPLYRLECRRLHGVSPVKLLGNVLFFEGPFKESQSGIYICEASYYHHRASVQIDVRITSEDRSWEYILICFSAATGLTIIATVFICIIIKVCK
ncbi:uncharacterized protein LOC131737744 [Acipenser ruthenus]|uniref:uncharacterized protein LOC131737744 n=1 Tax=Acipenser ruthenus TaxID=7906 RepID=UPI002741CCC2|nr:uncharacterized protein LOC131737744 [Acipenser ruthenus]